MITFVHTGDIHLDTPFSANFNKQQMQMRRREIMQTFRKIVLSAKNKDFLFISGDLFDGRFISSETIDFVKRCFAEIPDTMILISAGNHDPLIPGSAYLTTEWGDNVKIFGTHWEYLDFPEKQVRIHGRSFGDYHVENTLLCPVELAPDWCNIMVLHGDVVANGGDSSYNPMDKSAIAGTHVDYLALGHIHQMSELNRVDGVYYAYCGIPDGRGFDEEGEKGYYVGEASKGMVSLTRESSSCRRFWHVTCDVSNATDSFLIQELILDSIRKTGSDEDCYKVTLSGNARRGMVDSKSLCDVLSGYVFYLDIIDETKPSVLAEDMVKNNSLRSDFVIAMTERIASMPDEEKEIGYLALDLVLSAIERGQKS